MTFPSLTKNVFCFILLFFFSNILTSVLYAQTPGGVNILSNGDSLLLWHRAEDIPIQGNNQNRANWPTVAGFGDASIYVPDSNYYEIYNNLNYNKVVRLNDERFENTLNINAINSINVFTVYKTLDASDAPIWGNGYQDSRKARQLTLHKMTNGNHYNRTDYDHINNSRHQANTPYINQVALKDQDYERIYINGAESINNINSSSTINSTLSTYYDTLYIGNCRRKQDIHEAKLQMAEFIVYSGVMSQNERKKVTSYLAIKYGITLSHNYLLADGTIAWNRSNAGNYNHNIIGVANDKNPNNGNGSLQQDSSTSQYIGDFLDIYTESSSFLGDTVRRVLIVGHNGLSKSTTSSTNSIYGIEHIDRIWRTQSLGTYDKYTIAFDSNSIAPFNSSRNHPLMLFIAEDSSFTSNVQAYPLKLSRNKYYVDSLKFNNNEMRYFTIGVNEFYTNNDIGAPRLFEACANSLVSFHYDRFAHHPTKVVLKNNIGGNSYINTSITNKDTIGNKVGGIVTFTIPTEAITGHVVFLDNNSDTLHVTNQVLTIHPLPKVVDFLPKTAPICATDTAIQLYGFPSGGTFKPKNSSLPPKIITDTFLNATYAGWSPNHDSLKTIEIEYRYSTRYTNGDRCASSKDTVKKINIYDNRLNKLEFAPLIKNSINDTTPRLLTLDATHPDYLINTLEPNFCSSPTCQTSTYTFSGTFVERNPSYFLTGIASVIPTKHPITLRFENNGCIGEITADLKVYDPLKIDLPDTLCIQADTVTFYRDPTRAYSDTTITESNGTIVHSVKNKIIISTINSAQSSAILPTNGTDAVFKLVPTNLPNITSNTPLVVKMEYKTTITTTTHGTDNNGNPTTSVNSKVESQVILDTVILTPRPQVSTGLDSAYCVNGNADTLQLSPSFKYRSPDYRTYYTLKGANLSGQYTMYSNLFQDSILQPGNIYDTLVPSQNRNLPMRLTYTVKRYGCTDSVTDFTILIAPLNPSFLAKKAYCKNEPPSLLQRNVLTNGVKEYWLPAPGLDTVTGAFDPVMARSETTPITYKLKDQFDCVYTYKDTLLVRDPPKIEITLDGSKNNTTFCANPSSILIGSRLVSGTIIDSIQYTGRGVTDSIFNPNSAFVRGGGTATIVAEATDTFGCRAYDSLRVTIIQAPAINIDTAFNRERSNYGISNNHIAEHTYCKSTPPFIIRSIPYYLDTAANVSRGRITGIGVQNINNQYYYDPSKVPVGTDVDTVIYFYKDTIGCINRDMAIIKLNSVPRVTLNGFTNTKFCSNHSAVQLQGIPDTRNVQGTAIYKGSGVNPNTGLFTPTRARTGLQAIIYEFIDAKGCVNADTVNITVYAPTEAKFTGYKYQYCVSNIDTLQNQNDTTGNYYFYGNIIDSIGVLSGSDSTTGPQNIFYVYVDSNRCRDTASVNTYIHPNPEIKLFGLDSVYCHSTPSDIITVSPAAGGFVSSDTAFSISSVNTISLVPSKGQPGIKTFSYGYTDNNGCSDTLTARTYIYKPPTPSTVILDTFYCETNDTIVAVTNTNGLLRGPGIWLNSSNNRWTFIPVKAGVGRHTVVYSINDTLTGYILGNGQAADSICPADTVLNINVRPLPKPKFLAPLNNTRFCSNDSAVILLPDTVRNPVWNNFRDTSRGVSFTVDSIYIPVGGLFKLVADTTYYFSPDAVVPGIHLITYIATDSLTQCQDSIQITYIVDEYRPASFALDSIYCASNPPILLNGTPGGGLFTRKDSILNPTRTSPFFYFDPTDTSVVRDTVVYAVEYGACEDTVVKFVRINPLPQLSFTTINAPHNTYCLGGTPIVLVTTTGGSFDGSPGVLAGQQLFFPDLAGVGSHKITLNYTDSTTMCSNEFIDTLHVYGMPHIDFEVEGGCQHDTIYFKPNNRILGLGNTAQNRIVDSITSIKWVFSPSYSTVGTSHSNQIDSNVIDTITYVYDTAGVYNTQLIVANRVHCIDTQTVRLVISPKVSSYPYEQDFETDAGGWFAESRDSSHRLLWEWGLDNNNRGIAADATNHIWATQTNASYNRGEDAWVYSPCFDISSLKRPMISLDYWSHTRGQGADGTVLEYQRADGVWAPLGTVGRGTNWFNTPFIPGKPGDQFADDLIGTGWTAPLGWSGINTGWQNGRYKLDAFRGRQNTLRLRMAFASTNLPLNNFYDGFAFDNVIIRDRTRNVLLETMAHDAYSDMENINNHSYQLIHHTSLNKDVVLLQYHIESADGINTTGGSKDAFYLHNPSLGRTRAYEYNSSPAGRAFIDGLDSTYTTRNLSAVDFEQDMLATPKFSIAIDTFSHINGNFKIVARVKALQAMPTADYRIYTVISEDSLNYPNGSSYTSQIHAVVRENDQHHLDNNQRSPNIFHQYSWANDEVKRVEFNWNHTSSGFINYRPKPFQAIVFIQNITTKEIFQVASTRDVSGYWIDTTDISVDQVQVANELQEIQDMTLFPNPAHDYFHLKFEQALKQEYQWRLVDMRGVEVQQGNVAVGTEQLLIEGLQHPPGTYILLLHNKHVFVQRKVILGRP